MSVYFIKPVGLSGPVKIGCSNSPNSRRDALEKWSPFPLEIIAQVAGAHHHLEMRFHALFAHLHERKEWFTAAPELYRVIDQINAGTFDFTTLPPPRGITAQRRKSESSKRRVSYSLRISWAERRTGHKCPIQRLNLDDADQIAAVEAYLADPIKHGIPPAKRKAA